MRIDARISTELAYRLGWALVHSLWEGAAIAAIFAIVLACIPWRAAQARYLSLLVAMLVVLVCFVVAIAVGPESQPPRQTSFAETSLPEVSQALPSETARHIGDSSARTPLMVASPSFSAAPANWIKSISPFVAIFWLVGVLLLGAWRAAGWLGVQRLRVLKTEPVDPSILQTAQRLAQRLHLTRSFEILLSHFAQTPMVIGWLCPVILIPAAVMAGLTPRQLEGILAHELAHIRRQDYLVNLLQILAETVLFYHPAVWWISRQIRLEREQACDDVAISLCDDRHEYAGSLAALEELRLSGSPALAASGSGGGQMLARIRRILSAGDDAPRLGWRSIFSFLLIMVIAVALYSQEKAAPLGANPSHTPGAATAPSTRPFSLRNDAPRLSPFTAVRWRGDVSEVQYNGTWYELVSIDDVSASAIMDYLTQSKDFAPRKHFAEDLAEVMRDMGHEPSDTVKLELKTIDAKRAVTIPDAPMTEANRLSVIDHGGYPRRPTPHVANAVQDASTVPSTQSFSLRNDAPRLSPFSAVRWHGDVPEVEYKDTWYELISIDDVPASKIIDYLTQGDDFASRKHFAEDLVEVMRDMGHQPGNTVKLELKTLDTKQAVTIPGAVMSEENRKSVLIHDNSQRPPRSPQTTQAAASNSIFRFDVPFQQGATKFLDGDQIIITSVRGTAPDMESGICCITGKYILASHDQATLAASVTASDSKDGTGPWNAAQTMTIHKGTGTFTLLLPISIKGWPHVSFYDEKSDFGGSYVGTGDWVLRH